jgi:hypothetical protein
MSMRWIVIAMVLAVGALAYVAWNGSQQPTRQAAAPPEQGGMESGELAAPADTPDPGIEWKVPSGWTDQGPRMMRLATYGIPGQGGADAAECAVYYFGPGQGGTVEANMERWIGEFQNPSPPERSMREVNGLEVARVRVKGAYSSHGGSMGMGGGASPADGARSDAELLGAIVEGPSGAVFFKLTGPAKTVDAVAGDFDRMIGSVKKK